MCKFKIGDRVRVVREDPFDCGTIPVGLTGTVLEEYSCPWVELDNYHWGHDHTFGDGRDTVRAIYEYCLELLAEEGEQNGTSPN